MEMHGESKIWNVGFWCGGGRIDVLLLKVHETEAVFEEFSH